MFSKPTRTCKPATFVNHKLAILSHKFIKMYKKVKQHETSNNRSIKNDFHNLPAAKISFFVFFFSLLFFFFPCFEALLLRL